MPWVANEEGVSFSGELADLMSAIMTVYSEDATEEGEPKPGSYTIAAALAMRGLLLDAFKGDDGDDLTAEAAEFVQKVEDTVTTDDEGTMNVQVFELLDAIAEGADIDRLCAWLQSEDVRSAVLETARTLG